MKNSPYIVAEFLKSKLEDSTHSSDGTHPIVTVSRQHGIGGALIAKRIAEVLTLSNHGAHPWIAVDRNIAERVSEDHHLTNQITSFLTEEQAASVQDYLDLLFRANLTRASIVEKMSHTVIHLARMGNVVFVGRAAHVITAGFPKAVHIRLIGSFKRRVERIMNEKGCSEAEAEAEVRDVDQTRRTFVMRYFNVDTDDLQQYDLVINTDRVSTEEAAFLTAQLVNSPGFRESQARHLSELRHQVLSR